MNIILFDNIKVGSLYPFTLTRAIADIRCGIYTMRERWEKYLHVTKSSTLTVDHLQPVFEVHYEGNEHLYINAAIFPTVDLGLDIFKLKLGEVLVKDNDIIAIKTDKQLSLNDLNKEALHEFLPVIYKEAYRKLENPWDIFSQNGDAIKADFGVITHDRLSQPIPDYVTVIGDRKLIFIEEGAVVMPCILNVTQGPIYIGATAEIMEGCIIRAPFAMLDHAALKMGAKVYGPTTIGAGSKVGGEVNNVVFFDHSNKGHDGFLGNAVIGEWCNLGADTNSSNLKNNYEEVSIFDIEQNKNVKTGLQFCGLMMGDHSKCGINTMFNTGTVVGVSCNIYGGDFPDKYIPSFTWGGKDDLVTYRFDKAIDTAQKMMSRRDRSLSEKEITMLKYVAYKYSLQ